MIAAAMVAGAFSAGFDALYPMKIAAGVFVLACFVPVYRHIAWTWSWIAVANGVVVFAVWLGVDAFSHRETTAFAAGLQQLSPLWRLGWLGVRVLGSTLVVPMAEELAFRGYLMRRMMDPDFERISYGECSWRAVLVSSLLFALLHRRWFAGTLAGIFYALAARRRDLLCDAVVAHGVTNGFIAGYVLATGSWRLWS
jgi:CAAX prenyl protease-like protein